MKRREKKEIISNRRKTSKELSQRDREILKFTEEFIKRYRKDLEALAKK